MAAQHQAAAGETLRRDDDQNEDLHETTAFLSRGCCCGFWIGFPSRKSDNWERISSSERDSPPAENNGRERWWSKGMTTLKKAREWSELVAGPKWKTFIRRINRTAAAGRQRTGKFQYDPMSYALNFDEGPAGKNGQFDDGDDRLRRGFSSRFAAIPAQNGQVKDAPSLT